MKPVILASCALVAMILELPRCAAGEPTMSGSSLATLPYYNWTGVYVGGHLAPSEGRSRNTLFDPGPTGSSNSFGSLYGGVQIGYNYLLPPQILLGVEADISFSYFLEGGDVVSTRATTQGVVTETVDFVSTLRGRVGYAFDRWLIYGTGGFALLQGRFGKVRAPSATRTCDTASTLVGRSEPARRSPLLRTGPREWNISTAISGASLRHFHRAPGSNR